MVIKRDGGSPDRGGGLVTGVRIGQLHQPNSTTARGDQDPDSVGGQSIDSQVRGDHGHHVGGRPMFCMSKIWTHDHRFLRADGRLSPPSSFGPAFARRWKRTAQRAWGENTVQRRCLSHEGQWVGTRFKGGIFAAMGQRERIPLHRASRAGRPMRPSARLHAVRRQQQHQHHHQQHQQRQ